MTEDMREFWDERAREDAFYVVDNRIQYKDPNAEELFWALGRDDLNGLLTSLDMAIDPGAAVVEIGCGVGRLTRVIAERAASVRALDVSAEMLAIARRENAHLDNVEWVQGDGVSLAGIESASADLVISHVVFQHIPDPEITLGYVTDTGRVLKPGGEAAIQLSNNPEAHTWKFSRTDRIKERLGIGPKGRTNEAWLGSAVELDDLTKAAEKGGLEIEKKTGEGTQYLLVRLKKPS